MLRSVLLALALLTATPVLAQTAPKRASRPIVIGQSFTLPSAGLKETRRINVHLPAGYAAHPERRYPVLYLLDGGEQEDFPHIVGLAQLGELSWTFREMIVVGIEGTDRKRDMTAPSNSAEDRKLAPTSGCSAAFRRFLADELRPWVDQRFRVSGETALIGESLAGLFVVETFLKEPALFDAYIAASPSLWWNDQALARGAADDLARWPAGPRKLYLTIADEGSTMQEGVDRVVAALRAAPPKAVTWRYDPMPTLHHSTIYHPAALQAFRTVWPGPRPD